MADNDEGGSAKRMPPQGGNRPASSNPGRLASDERDASRIAADSEDDGEETLKPVSADMQQFIGRQLRAVFDDVAKQPVPDRFLELMKQLDGKVASR